jgi:hypothetical protein
MYRMSFPIATRKPPDTAIVSVYTAADTPKSLRGGVREGFFTRSMRMQMTFVALLSLSGTLNPIILLMHGAPVWLFR